MINFRRYAFLSVLVHLMFLFGLLNGCGTKKPTVVEESLKNPTSNIGHENFLGNCADCHDAERRPVAADLVIEKHGLGADCVSCHTFPDFKVPKPELIAHTPPPPKCLGCHDRVTEKTVHPARGECANCHQFPSGWTPVYP